MSILLAASGVAGSGKDSLGKFLVDNYNFTRISFADKVREYALAINPKINVSLVGILLVPLKDLVESIGWESAKRDYPEVREFLIAIGHNAREVFGSEFWIKLALSEDNLPELGIVTDVRYQNEADYIKNMGGIHIRIIRKGIIAPVDHITEQSLEADYIVENVNGNLENMYCQVREILDNLSWHTNTNPKTIS